MTLDPDVAKRTQTSWCIDDILDRAKELDIIISESEARHLLLTHGSKIVDRMVEAGWDAIDHLLFHDLQTLREGSGYVLTGSMIDVYYWQARKFAARLEERGLKHSSGMSVRIFCHSELGTPKDATLAQIEAAIDTKIGEIIKEAQDDRVPE